MLSLSHTHTGWEHKTNDGKCDEKDLGPKRGQMRETLTCQQRVTYSEVGTARSEGPGQPSSEEGEVTGEGKVCAKRGETNFS